MFSLVGSLAQRQKDRLGVAACIHSLLFHQEMKLIRQSQLIAARRGFCIVEGKCDHSTVVGDDNEVNIPQVTLKRYWNRPLWSRVFLSLLNNIGDAEGSLSECIRALELFLNDSTGRVSKLQTALERLVILMKDLGDPEGGKKK